MTAGRYRNFKQLATSDVVNRLTFGAAWAGTSLSMPQNPRSSRTSARPLVP